MRLSRFHLLVPLAAVGLAACRGEDIVTETRPPLAGVRYINAVPDISTLDAKMVDQLEYSANTVLGVAFRAGTEYFATEANKPRRIRVFPLNTNAIGTVSTVLADTSITFQPDRNYTLLLTGTAANSTVRIRVIEEAPPATLASTDVAVRLVNAGAGAVAGHVLATATTALGASPTFASVADFAASTYVTRAAGPMAVRIAAPGSTTAIASLAAATGTPGTALVNPVAGATVGGTVFSAYVFPRSTPGTSAPQTAAFLTAGVQLFVDRLPPNTVARP